MASMPERRCVFVEGRVCNVGAEEIPLEVCRLCLEAWKSRSSLIMVKRPLEEAEAPRVAQAVERKKEELPVEAGTKAVNGGLSELDRLFSEGRIGLEEYVERRKNIVNSAVGVKSWLKVLEARLLSKTMRPPMGMVVVEGERAKATYPKDWSTPSGFEGILSSIYELCKVLNKRACNMRLNVGEFKVSCLGYKDGKLMLLFLGMDQEFEDYEEIFRKIGSQLETQGSWEEMLHKLYEEYFQPRKFTYVS